jgi:hypothetical protein
MTADGKIEIMVASSVYGFEDQLNQICGLLEHMGYYPICSHYKTMPTNPAKSNLENCLDAVKNCDCFFGIIRPYYGSGIIGTTSITHKEMIHVIELKKPRWFIVHRDVRVARELLKQYRFNHDGSKNHDFIFKETKLLDDVKVIDMYEDTIQSNIPPEQRIGHWADEYFNLNDIMKVIQTQFSDKERIKTIIQNMKSI